MKEDNQDFSLMKKKECSVKQKQKPISMLEVFINGEADSYWKKVFTMLLDDKYDNLSYKNFVVTHWYKGGKDTVKLKNYTTYYVRKLKNFLLMSGEISRSFIYPCWKNRDRLSKIHMIREYSREVVKEHNMPNSELSLIHI